MIVNNRSLSTNMTNSCHNSRQAMWYLYWSIFSADAESTAASASYIHLDPEVKVKVLDLFKTLNCVKDDSSLQLLFGQCTLKFLL